MVPSFAENAGEFVVLSSDVGTTVEMGGRWLFTPQHEKREVAVPVPQMLSRIQWWLDDSEDFKKWEQARLDALGFDTEKNDDGWYRAIIDVPKLPEGRHLWIEFDGVAMRSKTFINGKPLGEHAGMFSRFEYDLTPHLREGKNELKVWVGMEKIPPTDVQLGEAVTVNLSAAKVVSMSKGMFGPLTPNQDNRAYDLYGIWQPVKLVVRGDSKIDDVWFQPCLTGAVIDIELSGKGQVLVRSTLTEIPLGNILRRTAGTRINFQQSARLQEKYIDLQPNRWTPAEPNLYRLDVFVEDAAGNLLDHWSKRVGFRTFEVKGNQFYLNGKPYWLRGANQLPYGKNPWDPQLPRKLIQLTHDGNQRFTRTHCTPWNEAWLDAADEIGLAVSIEGIRPWAFAGRSDQIGRELLPPPEVFQHWLMENEDVVKRCRNHPSVFIFTVGNEMMLRDKENMTKWGMLSEVTKQTRKLAPNHPIVVSSDYMRDPEFYETKLKPAGIDDGDIDDMHRYNGWYSDSPFVVDMKFEKERAKQDKNRPMIGQEMSSGYPDLDTGLPVLRYTRDLLTPQAWIGNLAYLENDPKWFLEHHAQVTKRWAEQLRFQRCVAGTGKTATAGFALFSSECWYRHSYLPTAEPYPVYDAVKQAFAPIGVAMETTQRRFFAGETFSSNVFITNDDEQFGDFEELVVTCELAGTQSEPQSVNLPYYATARAVVKLTVPQVEKRTRAQLITRVVHGEKEIAQTVDQVEIFPKPFAAAAMSSNTIVIPRGASLDDLAAGKALHQEISNGATAIVFAPAKEIVKLFPDDLLDVKSDVVEFADWSPCAGTKLTDKLEPMDLKWWARKGDWRAFVAGSSHRLKPGGKARELIRFIPAHSYIPAEKLPEQYRAIMSEIPIGKGRLWICDLDLPASGDVDPAANLFRRNLYRAAADPDSTTLLPKVPSHEELLKLQPREHFTSPGTPGEAG